MFLLLDFVHLHYMLNRRYIRIKVFQALYSYFQEGKVNAPIARKNLQATLDKTYDLYLFLLSFGAEFIHFAEQEIERQNKKYFPQENIIKPLNAILNNKAIATLSAAISLDSRAQHAKKRWVNQDDLFKKHFAEIRATELFQEYGALNAPTFVDDKNFLLNWYEFIAAESELFDSYLEEIFSNWEDDQTMVLTAIQKTLQVLKPNQSKVFLDRHKDEDEDLKFLADLFDKTIQYDEELTGYITAKTQNWEEDRIAMVDKLLMKMAICEMMYFPYIPVKVSINEYLELAKLYSTPNSHGFINGVLDKVQVDLKKEQKIQKLGRGLVE